MREILFCVFAMSVVLITRLSGQVAYYERAFAEISFAMEINYRLQEDTLATLRECRGEAPVTSDFNKGKIRR